MTTAMTNKAAGALAGLGNLKAGLAKVQASIPTAGGEPILRMGKDGIWIYGAENIEVEKGSKWAVNPLSLQHGYICWKKIPEGSKEKPEKLGEVLVSMFEDKPVKAGLPDYGHPWVEQTSVGLRCISGEDEGEQTEYKPSSVGGSNAMKAIIGAIMAQLDKDPEHPVPVVLLQSDSYIHSTWGKTYTPEIKIIDWIGMDGVANDEDEDDDAGQAPADEPAEETKPAETAAAAPASTRRRAAAAPVVEAPAEAETAAEQPAPAATGEVRRRRRG